MCLKGGTASPVTASTYLVDSRHNIQGWVEPTAKPTTSMLVNHSRKTIEITQLGRPGSFDDSVRAVRDMDPVGFAVGSTHPTAQCGV